LPILGKYRHIKLRISESGSEEEKEGKQDLKRPRSTASIEN